MEIRKGDIVGRKSYGKDIIFYVDRIIKVKNGKSYVILKGVHYRIEADAEISDLEKIDKNKLDTSNRGVERKIKERIAQTAKNILLKKDAKRNELTNAVILHLDGDKRYTQKSQKYYNNLGMKAIVKNVPENRQPQVIGNLVRRYNPDIIVITRT